MLAINCLLFIIKSILPFINQIFKFLVLILNDNICDVLVFYCLGEAVDVFFAGFKFVIELSHISILFIVIFAC